MPCSQPEGRWVSRSVPKDFLMGYQDSGPIVNAYEGRDAAGSTTSTTTTTTASTTVTTSVTYEPIPGRTYMLFNNKSGDALGLANDQRSIIGSTPRGLDEQWKCEQPRGSGGAWRFRNMGSGKYLDFGGDALDGARLIGSRVPRNWKIRRDSEELCTFRIYVPKTDLNITLVRGDDGPGAPITLEQVSNSESQVWRFEPTSMVLEENGDEIVSTTSTTTITRVTVVTKIKKTA